MRTPTCRLTTSSSWARAALTPDSPAPDIARVRDGLKVVLFEQTSEVLEQRFGFRVEEYGLRWVFKRVPDHPLLAGIGDETPPRTGGARRPCFRRA